jgi:purine-nucleoside phosphorylase
MQDLVESINRAEEYLASKIETAPRVGMITGTGLSCLTDKLSVEFRIAYSDIPYFPKSTADGHAGNLVYGEIAGRKTIAMEGRCHLYEGYTPQQVTFPLRVMSRLGVEVLLVSSAAGGLNPHFLEGDLMILTDHINVTGRNPLIGRNLEAFGPRFPDLSEVYDSELITLAKKKALAMGLMLREGVYAGVLGPSLETPAETRVLRMMGADAVGMSTVLEAIVGRHCGLRIAAIVAITNINLPDCMKKTSIEDVISIAEGASASLGNLWEKIIENLPE